MMRSDVLNIQWSFWEPAVLGRTCTTFLCRITTPQLNYVGAVCVRFYYHMNGNDMGELRTYLLRGNDNSLTHTDIWSMSGNRGNAWFRASVNVELSRIEEKASITLRIMVVVYYLHTMCK